VASVEEEPAWVAKPLLLAREAAGLVSLLAAELNASGEALGHCGRRRAAAGPSKQGGGAQTLCWNRLASSPAPPLQAATARLSLWQTQGWPFADIAEESIWPGRAEAFRWQMRARFPFSEGRESRGRIERAGIERGRGWRSNGARAEFDGTRARI
jgi:hypothetical protein